MTTHRAKFTQLSGYSLVEMMIVVAIFSVAVLSMSVVVRVLRQSYVSNHSNSVMNVVSQKALNRIKERLGVNRRIFEWVDTSVVSPSPNPCGVPAGECNHFLEKIDPAPSNILPDRKLPIIDSAAVVTLPPSDPNNVGNSLFFASYDQPEDIQVDDPGPFN